MRTCLFSNRESVKELFPLVARSRDSLTSVLKICIILIILPTIKGSN